MTFPTKEIRSSLLENSAELTNPRLILRNEYLSHVLPESKPSSVTNQGTTSRFSVTVWYPTRISFHSPKLRQRQSRKLLLGDPLNSPDSMYHTVQLHLI